MASKERQTPTRGRIGQSLGVEVENLSISIYLRIAPETHSLLCVLGVSREERGSSRARRAGGGGGQVCLHLAHCVVSQFISVGDGLTEFVTHFKLHQTEDVTHKRFLHRHDELRANTNMCT